MQAEAVAAEHQVMLLVQVVLAVAVMEAHRVQVQTAQLTQAVAVVAVLTATLHLKAAQVGLE
jgi:hypothetical protein